LFLEETDLVRNKALHLAVPKSFAKQVSIVTALSDAAVDMPKSDCPQFVMHILRRTLATSMLRAKVPRSVISAAIGQVDPNSVDAYLSADSGRMRECALPLDGIECEREEILTIVSYICADTWGIALRRKLCTICTCR
jgi:hypothetical protein